MKKLPYMFVKIVENVSKIGLLFYHITSGNIHIALKIPFEQILNEICNSIVNNELDRIDLITRKVYGIFI
jgi:hypothetical protein